MKTREELTALLGHLAADGLGDLTRDRQRIRGRELADELYELAQYDLGARILPLVKELHETRDITRFIGQVSVWIAQPARSGRPEDPDALPPEIAEAAARQYPDPRPGPPMRGKGRDGVS